MRQQLVALAFGLWVSGSNAATPIPTTATFAVSATVVAGCMVVGNPTQTSGVTFGMLDFGNHPAVSTSNVSSTVSMSGGQMAQLQCTTGVSVTMTVDGGQNSVGNQRRMKRGTNQYVPYSLYAAPNGVTPITPGNGISVSTNGSAWTLPVWGIASPPGSSLPGGSYSDTVQVLFSW